MGAYYTIIIPTHNSSKTIKGLLGSIPERNLVEIIIVDDYSSDAELASTIECVDAGGIAGCRLILNKGVNSAGAARNLGLKNASGRYVLFADSDDYFDDNLGDMLEKYKDTSHDVVFFGVSGNVSSPRVDHINNHIKSRNLDMLRYNHPVPWSKIISLDFIKKNNISFSEVMVSNDELFSTKVGYYAKDVAIDDTSIYVSCHTQGSLTTQNHDKAKQDIRMNEYVKKYRFLKSNMGQRELSGVGMSIVPALRKSFSVGGLFYALSWAVKLYMAGGRFNLRRVLSRRLKAQG